MAEQVDLDCDDQVDADFDADWADEDREAKPPRIRLLGEVVTLPPALPALVVLFTYRSRRGSKERFDPQDYVQAIGALLGHARVQRALDTGVSFERLSRVFWRSIDLYKTAKAPEGEAAAPAGESTGSASSSGTGASSSPTGAASTTPTSATNSVTGSPGPASGSS